MFGVKVLVLGRIGKAAIYLSGFVILIDILGERRFRRAGKYLRISRRNFTRISYFLLGGFIYYLATAISYPARTFGKPYQFRFRNWFIRVFAWVYRGGLFATVVVPLGYIVIVIVVVQLLINEPIYRVEFADFSTSAKIIFLSLLVIYSPVWLIRSIRDFSRIFTLIDLMFVKPMIRILTSRRFVIFVRTLSFIVFSIGCYLDLLAA